MGKVKKAKKRLYPALWPACRVIAHKTRLHLFEEIYRDDKQCVAELARQVGITKHNASTQLRVLHTFGLILPYRRKQKVFYAAEATTSVEYAEALLTALRKCVEEKMPIETMIRQATAFTHQRRIEIVRALSEKSKTPVELAEATGITSSALARHLDKLEARGIIEKTGYQYSLACPQNSLGQTLLQSALSRKY